MSKLLCPMCDHGVDAQEAGVVNCRNCWHVFRIKDGGALEPVPPGYTPEGWQLECERLAFNASALLRLARRHIANSAVVEVIRRALRSKEEVVGPRGMTDTSLMYRLFFLGMLIGSVRATTNCSARLWSILRVIC